MHFNRGQVQHHIFKNKINALKAVEIAVFHNEDCINCSIYRSEVKVTAGENGMYVPIKVRDTAYIS